MTPPTGRRKPNHELRKAFDDSDCTCGDIARALHLYRWSDGRDRPDDQKVRRALGLQGNQKTVDVDFGRRIARAMGYHPQEVGL